MFLTARIFGVFTYSVLLFISILAVRYVPQRQTKYVFWAYLLALCCMAWFYVPYMTTDIYRLQPIAQSYADMSANEFIYLLSTSTSGLFTFVYFRIFADCLMPVTCAIFFGIIFYIIYQSGKLFNVTRSVLLLVLLWIMTNDFYLLAITNIRSYVAVAFVSFCIYRETFQHKFGLLNILLYFCAVEMHSMGIVLVAFRVLMYLFPGGKLTIWKLLLIPVLLGGLIWGFNSYSFLLESSIDKFEDYYANNEYYEYIWERILFIMQTIVQGYILWKAYSQRIFKENNLNNYRNIVIAGVIVLLICYAHDTFLQRWIVFATILDIPVLMRLLQKENENKGHNIRRFIMASCIITFALVCTRGNLCSLKFWE